MRGHVVSSIRPSFPGLSQSQGQVTHVLLTRSPLIHPDEKHPSFSVRLACVKHAASVRPEPGSNSPSKTLNRNHNHNDHGIPADTQHPKETGKTPQSIRPSTKKTNSWYQQTRHTIELTNNKPLLDTLRVRSRLRSASLGEIGTAGQIRLNPGVLLKTYLAISCSRGFILAHPRRLAIPWNREG